MTHRYDNDATPSNCQFIETKIKYAGANTNWSSSCVLFVALWNVFRSFCVSLVAPLNTILVPKVVTFGPILIDDDL